MGNVPAYPSIRLLSKKFGQRGYELKISPRYTDEEFMEFCAENPELRIEMDKNKRFSL